MVRQLNMERQPVFEDAMIMPFDMDQDGESNYYYQPDSYDDDQTATTASSPITPSSDNSILFSSWSSCSQDPVMDLSSWDATPEWIRTSPPRQFPPRNSSEADPKYFAGYPRDKKSDHIHTIHSYAAIPDDSIHSPRPSKKARKNEGAPLRFVSVTPASILSGDIHRTQGEWKRGRPRLVRPAPKSKTRPSAPASNDQEFEAEALQSSVAFHCPKGCLASPCSQSLFGPVFDHLRVTTQEQNFFAALLAPGEL